MSNNGRAKLRLVEKFHQMCQQIGGEDLLSFVQNLKEGFIFGQFVFATNMFHESIEKDDGRWQAVNSMDICVKKSYSKRVRDALDLFANLQDESAKFAQYNLGAFTIYVQFVNDVEIDGFATRNQVVLDFLRDRCVLSVEEIWYVPVTSVRGSSEHALRPSKILATKKVEQAWDLSKFNIAFKPLGETWYSRLGVPVAATSKPDFIKATMRRVRELENEFTFDLELVTSLKTWRLVATWLNLYFSVPNVQRWNQEFARKSPDQVSGIPKFLFVLPSPPLVLTESQEATREQVRWPAVRHSDLKLVANFAFDKSYTWRCPWTSSLSTQVVFDKHSVRSAMKLGLLNPYTTNELLPQNTITINGSISIPLASFHLLNQDYATQVSLHGKLPTICYSLSDAEFDYSLDQFIESGCDGNVVLFTALNDPSGPNYKATCVKRTQFLHDRRFYQCLKRDSEHKDSVVVDTPFVRIELESPFYIPKTNYQYMMNNEDVLFYLVKELPYSVPYTVSKEVIEQTENIVSADHCQESTAKKLHALFPIDPNSIVRIQQKMRSTRRMRDLAMPKRASGSNRGDGDDNDDVKSEKEFKSPSAAHDDDDEDDDDSDAHARHYQKRKTLFFSSETNAEDGLFDEKDDDDSSEEEDDDDDDQSSQQGDYNPEAGVWHRRVEVARRLMFGEEADVSIVSPSAPNHSSSTPNYSPSTPNHVPVSNGTPLRSPFIGGENKMNEQDIEAEANERKGVQDDSEGKSKEGDEEEEEEDEEEEEEEDDEEEDVVEIPQPRRRQRQRRSAFSDEEEQEDDDDNGV